VIDVGASVGIDLGTTNTCVAVVHSGRAVALADDHGRRLIPSIVSFHPSGQVLVGDAAKQRRLNDPKNTIYSVKRLLGRRWSAPEVQRLRQQLPFELVEGPRESVSVRARDETYALPEISAFVLRRARDIAQATIDDVVDAAVITVPANFNDLQRASTKVAGELAGLEVLRIMNEPTAAALAYGQALSGAQRIAVYDFGGGTFDLSLLDLSRSVYEVLMTKGDTALGGDDIDAAIAERMAEHVTKTLNIGTDAPEIKARLRFYAELVKIQLSSANTAEIALEGLGHGPGGVELETTFAMSRPELELLAVPFVERTIQICEQAMAEARLSRESFDAIVLVGGSTRMPYVARRVAEFFRREPFSTVNPEEVVAIGASIQASMLGRARPRKPSGEMRAVQGPGTQVAAPPPLASQTERMPVSAPTPLAGPLLIDVTPLSLGVETAGGYTDVILAAGTPVPCDKTRTFVTASDRQTHVIVRVCQGHARVFAQNTYLGECELSGLRPAPRGAVKIAVTFEIDASGILVVRARDAETGQEAQARLRPFGAQIESSDVAAMRQRMAQKQVLG
jgi:molecular chaperone DnaK